MNRSNKKLKLIASNNFSRVNSESNGSNSNGSNNGSNAPSGISSGNFMTSCLHDDPNEDVDMAIPSPDATNNEVLDTINPDQEHHIIIVPEIKVNELAASNESRVLSKKLQQQQTQSVNRRTVDDNYVNISNETNVCRPKVDMATGGSISGGLTLDKTNKSLKNLIFYIKTAYSNNLTSPKWKNFKGLKLQVMEKIRLNNVIWRTWFEQYGIKNVSKRKRPLVCQFANTLEETTTTANLAILEGKYWKRRLESITNEYKKWRELSRKRLKPFLEYTNPPDFHNFKGSLNKNQQNHLNSTNLTNTSGIVNIQQHGQITDNNLNTVLNVNNNFNNNENTNQIGIANNANYTNTSCYNFYQNSNTNNNSSNIGTVVNDYDYLNNTEVYMNSNVTTNTTNGSFYSGNNVNNGFSEANNLSIGPSTPSSNHHYHHMPITSSKQMTYNNRCRSPSPGLFQDFDLFNFSSDTLFSTHCFEDPKDPVFGTNPDLFQPDLLHLYPNFDFLELDIGFHDTNSNVNNSANMVGTNLSAKPTTNLIAASSTLNSSPKTSGKSINRSIQISSPSKNPNQLIEIQPQQQQNHHISRGSIPIASKANNVNTPIIETNQSKQDQEFSTMDNYYNFNTLASVAAASPSISPNRNQTPKLYPINIEQNEETSNSNLLTNLKLPVNNKEQITMDLIQSTYNPNQSNTSNNLQISVSSLNNNNNINNNNSSSNTIRNLLALNSTGLIKEFNNSKQPLSINENTYVPVEPTSNVPNRINHNHSHHAKSFAITNKPQQQQSTNLTMPKDNISSFQNIISTSQDKSSLNTEIGNRNPQISALLSAVLAPKITQAPINNEIDLVINNDNQNQTLKSQQQQQQQQPQSQTKKRGRKSNIIKAAEEVAAAAAVSVYNEQLNNYPDQQQLVPTVSARPNNNFNNSKQQQKVNSIDINKLNSTNSSIKQINQKKRLDELPQQPSSDINIDNIQIIINSQFQQQQQPQDQHYPSQQYRNFKKQFINENSDNNSANSPMDSPSSNSSNFNSPNACSQQQQLNSLSQINNDTSPSSFGNSSSFLIKNNNQQTSTTSSNFIGKLPKLSPNSIMSATPSTSSNNINQDYMNFGPSSVGTTSRLASRSNSVNSVNTFNDGNLSSAEQKRRCNIQHGFDHLQTLVPSLADGGKNSKASKAAMLQKTSEYIKELQVAREKRVKDLNVFKREIEQLSDKISECQNQLPANGVSIIGNLNKTEKFEQKFNAYVKEKTVDNWKFYLFSLILKPLFDNFVSTINTSSKEDMERSFYEWQQKYCNLTQLRPIASNALRQLSKSTSILSDSNKLPEECYSAALTRI